jgi:hypothetical protein
MIVASRTSYPSWASDAIAHHAHFVDEKSVNQLACLMRHSVVGNDFNLVSFLILSRQTGPLRVESNETLANYQLFIRTVSLFLVLKE